MQGVKLEKAECRPVGWSIAGKGESNCSEVRERQEGSDRSFEESKLRGSLAFQM